MPGTNLSSAAITDMTNAVDNYAVDPMQTDAAGDQKETRYTNSKWSQQLGYYKKIPELQKAIQALAIWTAGKGFTADDKTEIMLEGIKGWGEDDFIDILKNMIITKKIGGDAFAEIIRDLNGTLINLKPLDPASIVVIVDDRGIIKRYEQVSKNKNPNKKFKPSEIFHLCNDRIADEIHGTSIIDACEWVILARNEAMEDWKRVLHRNVVPVRIIEVDSDDTAKIAALKKQYEDVIKKGEVIVIPKGNVEIKDSNPVLQDSITWIQYLENFFYQAVGVPRVIATSENYTESGSKVGFLTFEPVYTAEQFSLEKDLWNQLAIKITFNRPPSLGGDLQRDEAKDAGQQTAFQPNDTTAGVGA